MEKAQDHHDSCKKHVLASTRRAHMDNTGLSSRLVANYYHILLERIRLKYVPLAAIYNNVLGKTG